MKVYYIKYVFMLLNLILKIMIIIILKNKNKNLEKIQIYKNYMNHLMNYLLMKNVHMLIIKVKKI